MTKCNTEGILTGEDIVELIKDQRICMYEHVCRMKYNQQKAMQSQRLGGPDNEGYEKYRTRKVGQIT